MPGKETQIFGATPPIEWFIAQGREDKGISIVTTNEQFKALKDGLVHKHFWEWSHFGGNPGGSKKRQEHAKKVMKEAEEFLLKETGFTPRQILEHATQLLKQYRGQSSCPFQYELY